MPIPVVWRLKENADNINERIKREIDKANNSGI